MELKEFKTKHKELFIIGACSHTKLNTGDILIIDRYVDGEFVCERNLINKAQADARKMGFNWIDIGRYYKTRF